MSDDRLPVGLLLNTCTGRYHPIVFAPRPRPSEHDDDVQRHYSREHHTEGFATREAAVAHVADVAEWRFCDVTWRWDGEPFGAMRWYFSRSKA